ncbi:serine/threonine-protein phosphatase [Microbacteriaceae bacterium VKM Ac-2854]|nr:serine/threonine-protein phosphatase [Microbacteriaceae bacterium VKM Ac-2854]
MTERTIDLPAGTLRLAVSACTDVGRLRKVNEDAVLVGPALFAVADGMGGHARGDLASAAAIATLERLHPDSGVVTVDELFGIVGEANDAVRGLEVGGALCGTTLTGLTLAENEATHAVEWALFNVGDSRVYRWDGAALTQLSVDHSAVQELVDAGFITRAQAEEHPDRNIITRALGADEFVDADVWTLPILPESSYLICSDGLTKEVSDDRLALLFARRDAKSWLREDFAGFLVQEALDAGGRDNVTVIVIDARWLPGDGATGGGSDA